MSGAGQPCVLRTTGPFVYVRLHGPTMITSTLEVTATPIWAVGRTGSGSGSTTGKRGVGELQQPWRRPRRPQRTPAPHTTCTMKRVTSVTGGSSCEVLVPRPPGSPERLPRRVRWCPRSATTPDAATRLDRPARRNQVRRRMMITKIMTTRMPMIVPMMPRFTCSPISSALFGGGPSHSATTLGRPCQTSECRSSSRSSAAPAGGCRMPSSPSATEAGSLPYAPVRQHVRGQLRPDRAAADHQRAQRFHQPSCTDHRSARVR